MKSHYWKRRFWGCRRILGRLIRDFLFLEDHLKELNSALKKRDQTIEDLKRRLLEMGAEGPRQSRNQEKDKGNAQANDMEISLIQRENEDLKMEVDEYLEKEKDLLAEIQMLKKQNSELSDVLNPMKKDKNKFYQKFFEQEKKIEILENKVSSLMDDNTNLKKILEKKNEGKGEYNIKRI
jgi:chromosome segregation ATPase